MSTHENLKNDRNKLSDKIISDEIISDKIISDEIKSDEIKSDEIKSDEIISDEIKSEKVENKVIYSNEENKQRVEDKNNDEQDDIKKSDEKNEMKGDKRKTIKLDDDVNINKIIEKISKEEPQMLTKILNLMKNDNCLNFYPLLTPYHNIEKIVDILIEENYEYENTWCVHYDASFICQLFYEGFIPVASKQKVCKIENYETKIYKECLLIPKIHYIRSCMHPSEIHISKKVKKKCKNFYITIDKDFNGVMEGIVEKHGQNWLYPFVQKEFKRIFEKSVTYKNVQMHSVEVWYEDKLVAGEIGITVGSIYTSLTGFQRKNCAGTIQLCALAKLLEFQKFQLWDLGMLLPYKKEIGSKEIPMKEFFRKHRVFKFQNAEFKVPFKDKLNCSVLIKGTDNNDFD